MYLASATRPDISFAVSKLSRFVSNPGDDHWNALERVMRYLVGTMDYGIHYTGYRIHYTGYPKVLEGYSDSNQTSNADEIKAQVDMCSHSEVALFPGSLASIPS
jgi:hypothetical protein